MKIFKEIYKDKELTLSSFKKYFDGLKYAIFDIETTGLSPKNCHVILTGFVIPMKNGDFQLIQYFAQSPSDEALVLNETCNILDQLDFIITFNGKAFDISFLEKRLSALNISPKKYPSDIYNLDIYRVVKKFSKLQDFLPNLKQKTLENFLGLSFTRLDEIDGGKSVEKYYEYLATGDTQLENDILLHNADDVKQLYRLCDIFKKLDFDQAMYQLGFPRPMTVIEKIHIHSNTFILSARTSLPDCCVYDDNINLHFSIVHGQLDLELKLCSKDSLLFFDLRKFLSDNLVFSDNSYFSKDQDVLTVLEYFANCNGLYLDHFLLLSVDGTINYGAANMLAKYLIERIESNEY